MADASPGVKICGLVRREDASRADEAGANFLGIILSAGFGRSVSVGDAGRILAGTTAARVAVVVDETPTVAAFRARAIDASVIQLHGNESLEVVTALRAIGDWTIWKAVRAASVDDLDRAVDRFRDVVDGFLVEGWREGVVGGEGVGLEVDPASVRRAIPPDRTFVLAGGLRADSVAGAVARFAPDVVDVSSGVERFPGSKDHGMVDSFIQSARATPPSGGETRT